MLTGFIPTYIYTLRKWVYKIKVYRNSVYNNIFYQIKSYKNLS